MQNRKTYGSEFKLNAVKEYLNGDKFQAQICEEHSISPSIFFRWLKKYKESGYNDSIFNVSKDEVFQIVEDTIIIFESAVTRKQIQVI